jgi:hypothetical protein
VNHGVVNLNGEKEYEEKAGAYWEAQGIVEYVNKGYDLDQEIKGPIAEIFNAIDADRTSGLYHNEELLSSFKHLSSSCEYVHFRHGGA